MPRDLYDTMHMATSWSRTKRERSCPPDSVLFSEQPSPELVRHLELCPPCRRRRGDREDESVFEELAEMLSNDSLPRRPAIEPGQLWQVDPERGGWDADGFHYNAPVVLILEVFPYTAVRVAQISHYLCFAGNEDVHSQKPYPCFAEPWNTYSLPVAWLDIFVGEAGEEIAWLTRETLERKMRDSAPPDMAGYGTPTDLFRQLELANSIHFSQAAIGEVMRLTEEYECGGQQRKKIVPFARAAHVCQLPKDIYEYAPAAGSNRVDLGREYSPVHAVLDLENGSCTVENQGHQDMVLLFYTDGEHGKSIIPQRDSGETYSILPRRGHSELYLVLPESGYSRITLEIFQFE